MTAPNPCPICTTSTEFSAMSVLHVANQRHVAWRCGRCGGEWTTVEELGGDSASGPSLAERRKTSSPRM